jgi:hypothetical protein
VSKKTKPFGGYDWMKVTVTEGKARIDYRVTGLKRDGHDGIDEDVSEWDDDSLRMIASRMLGVPDEDANKIEVVWD